MLNTEAKRQAVVRQFNSRVQPAGGLLSPEVRSAILAEVVLGMAMGQDESVTLKSDDIHKLLMSAKIQIRTQHGDKYLY